MAARPVAKGGMFGAAERPAYSKETQDLLKVMMEESRLTNFQRRKLQESMKDGRSLPTRVAPTSSEQKIRSPPKTKSPQRLVISSNMRTFDRIEGSGAYEREKYVPKPIRSLEKEKERLSSIMAYGEEPEKVQKKKTVRAATPPPLKDRFDEIEEEISERRQFLSEMEQLGQGGKYRPIINTQISQLVREMEVIDKQRSAVLEKAILEQQAQ